MKLWRLEHTTTTSSQLATNFFKTGFQLSIYVGWTWKYLKSVNSDRFHTILDSSDIEKMKVV